MPVTTNRVIERTKFYEEIARGGLEYTPPAQYFADVLYAIEDMQKQINDLREDNRKMQTELVNMFK
jgi:hypothetical protein